MEWLLIFRVRDTRAGYKQSLSVLEYVKRNHPDIITKTSIMVGWAETDEEIRKTMQGLFISMSPLLSLFSKK